MRKFYALFSFLLVSGWATAEPLKTVFNPFTGKLDYITRIDSNTIQPGTNVTVTSNSNGTVTVGSTGGGGGTTGTITASPQFEVGYYTNTGSTQTIGGAANFTTDGSSVTVSTSVIGSLIVTHGILTSTISAISASTPQLIIGNPNFAGTYNADLEFTFGSNPLGYLDQLEGNDLCSDLSTVCMTNPLGYGPSKGTYNFGIDQNGKLSVGAYTGSESTATVWGNMLIGSGYATRHNAPLNGLQVQGSEIIDSSLTVSGPGGLGVTYGAIVGSMTVSNLASGQCVQTGTAGLLTGTGSACGSGSGGGSSALAVTTGSASGFIAITSSPTAAVNFDSSTFNVSLKGGSTAFVQLNFVPVTSITGTSPINSSGGTTPVISLSQTIGQSETITGSSLTVNAINGLVVTGATTAPLVQISTAPGGVTVVSVSSTLASAPSDGVVTVSSQTGTITFQAQYDGHLISSGTTPSMGTCGTSPSVIGTDTNGHINVGSGVVTSCTLNFANAFGNNAPDCIASTNSTAAFADVTTVSTTSVTFGLSATLGGGIIWFHCYGERG